MHNPFRYFNSSPEVIRLAVMMYIRYPLSLRRSKISCSNGVSISVTRRCGTGGIGLGPCLQPRSGTPHSSWILFELALAS